MQKQIIIRQLDRIFNGPAWHGPALAETLDKIRDENSNKTFQSSHSIVELIAHMTAWRNYVIEQLSGNADFTVSDEMNFPKNAVLNAAIASLKESQKRLIDAITLFPEDRLKQKVGNKPYSFQTMLHGIIHHDLYHLGQIALLNR